MNVPVSAWMLFVVLLASSLIQAAAQLPRFWGKSGASPGKVTYTISLANPEQHLAHVQIILPPGPSARELQLPVWNALYQIRDFPQFVNSLHAQDRGGHALAVRQRNKCSWQIEGTAAGALVQYEIFLDSPGPFGVQVNSHHAFLNLAQVLMYAVDARNSQLTLHFSHIPSAWHIATPLKSVEDSYVAENYDRLVDSPVEIGPFQETDFDESGAHFRIIIDADSADYKPEQITDALRRIVSAAISWMKDRPFDEYIFFYHFPRGPAGGGMEHAYSTAIEINAASLKQSLDSFGAVSAHEFFHLWNVKRIRPRTLEPIDYTKENYTRALWFSEGVTSTVENLLLFRAGLMNEKQFLTNIANEITELQSRPAHLTQSAEVSSLDAWLEGFSYYRRPERSISYYNKGELLGFLLDLAVRDKSQGRACLRDVLQWMNRNYAQAGKYFDDSSGVRAAAEATAHADLREFFDRYVAGTDEIPWNDFFRGVGLRVEAITLNLPDPGFNASRNFDGPLSVVSVTPGGEAEHLGVRVGDIIVEFQGKPAADDFQQQLSRLMPGQTMSLKVRSHRGGEKEMKWKMGSRQELSYQLRDLDRVSAEQRVRRAAWLKGEAQPASGISVP